MIGLVGNERLRRHSEERPGHQCGDTESTGQASTQFQDSGQGVQERSAHGVAADYGSEPRRGMAPFFTATTAWEFIASRLEAGEEVEVINLRKPPGSKGYVMKIDLELGLPKLYVKLQLVSKKVIGRSFHYSEY